MQLGPGRRQPSDSDPRVFARDARRRRQKATVTTYTAGALESAMITRTHCSISAGHVTTQPKSNEKKQLEQRRRMIYTTGPNGESIQKYPTPDDPTCPRCSSPLEKLQCPPGMSIASWCFHRRGDYSCPSCVRLQNSGKLHIKAKTAWYTAYLAKVAYLAKAKAA